MATITDYASLKANVADFLNRSDLTTAISTFVQLAERKFMRDRRYRKLTALSASIADDSYDMPSDFHSVESWYHDGSTYFGPILVVGAEQLGHLKAQYGQTGVPAYAAVVDGVARFAPEPDDTYATEMMYWRIPTALSDSNTTNWLLTSHPDIYLYGALLEAEPYLKNDARIMVWRDALERAAEELHLATAQAQTGGALRRSFKPIG